MFSLDPGTATVVAASIAAASAVIVALIHSVRSNVKRVAKSIEQVSEDNRTDHAYVVRKLTKIAETVHEVKLDTKDMKYDILELKDMQREHTRQLRNHHGRIDHLEDVFEKIEEE